CGPSQHLLGNHRVELAVAGADDLARSRTYARVMHVGAGDLAELSYECYGEYTDTWTRTPEGWRIRSREFHVGFDRGDRRVLRPEQPATATRRSSRPAHAARRRPRARG